MSTAVGYTLLKELAALQQGRMRVPRSQGYVYGVANGPPVSNVSGIDVAEATEAFIALQLRKSNAEYKAWGRVDIDTGGETYRIDLSRTQLTGKFEASHTSAGTGAADVVDALVASVNGLAPDDDMTYVAEPHPTDEAAFTITMAATNRLLPSLGAFWHNQWNWHDDTVNRMRMIGEASYASVRLWAFDAALGWKLLENEDRIVNENTQWTVDVAGIERVYVEVMGTDGLLRPLAYVTRVETDDALLTEAAAYMAAEDATIITGWPQGCYHSNGLLGLGKSNIQVDPATGLLPQDGPQFHIETPPTSRYPADIPAVLRLAASALNSLNTGDPQPSGNPDPESDGVGIDGPLQSAVAIEQLLARGGDVIPFVALLQDLVSTLKDLAKFILYPSSHGLFDVYFASDPALLAQVQNAVTDCHEKLVTRTLGPNKQQAAADLAAMYAEIGDITGDQLIEFLFGLLSEAEVFRVAEDSPYTMADVADTNIYVVYSHWVDPVQSTNPANYEIRDSGGNIIAPTSLIHQGPGVPEQVNITFNAATFPTPAGDGQPDSNWTILINNVLDSDTDTIVEPYGPANLFIQ